MFLRYSSTWFVWILKYIVANALWKYLIQPDGLETKKMTTNFDESYKYCIIKWIDWMFYIWFKVRDLFSHRKHFFSENYDIGLGDISRKD